MDGQPHLLLERLDEYTGRVRLTQSGHVLDPEYVRPHRPQLPGDLDVVSQVVFGLARVAEISRVADRGLAQSTRISNGLDGYPHVVDPIQAVEHAEDVDAGLRRLRDEVAHDIVRVVGVADRVRRPQQHLQQQIGHPLAKIRQSRPGVLAQEAHRHVERCAAPAFDGEKIRQQAGIERGDCRHVVRTKSGREQGLVRIPHAGIRDQHAVLLEHPGGEPLRPQFVQFLFAAGCGRRQDQARQARKHRMLRRRPPCHLGVAVDDDIGDEAECSPRPQSGGG